ncbi:GNAT family N-acetyltransferase [Streptococcus anginosus]|nr:GNAT family N-acetyltransferase [Streptococcus anginosus]AGU83392.1 acetyltransferase, GNAT family [Streptococcus anginosus C238]QQT10010.1 GNAT family N-acetyltransferase [Streptococcus anginosus]
MVGEIRAVEKSHLADWAYFAHLAWKTEKKKLLAAFSEGKFPNEFLYYLEGETVAWISLSMRSEYMEGAEQFPVAYIEGIAVAPAFQRNGIDTQLVDFAQSWATEKGVSQLASDCDIDNVVSQAFHKSGGFKEISRTVHYILHLDKKG